MKGLPEGTPEGSGPLIYIVSDALGETAEFVVRAAASQFNSGHVQVRRISYVDRVALVADIVEEAVANGCSVVAYTLVLREVRERLEQLAAVRGITTVDILGPVLTALSKVTSREPKMEPGLLRRLDEEYFRKMEAIDFAVKYDDGKDPRGLLYADVVLIGVSRTSKTPVSMYLAHKRFRAANVPLVPEVAPPEELNRVSRQRVIGLTIDPEHLAKVRLERLKSLGLTAGANYANPVRCLEEVTYAEGVMKRMGCPVIDVTSRAVEETAGKVLELYFKGERHGR